MYDFKNWLQGYLEDKLEPQQIDRILGRLQEEMDQYQFLPLLKDAPEINLRYISEGNLENNETLRREYLRSASSTLNNFTYGDYDVEGDNK